MIVPIIGFTLTLVMLFAYLIMSGKDKKKASKSNNNSKNSISQMFINILDIHDDILYGLDNYKRIFIEVEGICIDLLNKNDIRRLIRELSSEISKLYTSFDIFAISRPFNIEMLKNQYEEEILNAKTDIQRTLLRNSLKQILEFGENGEVVERKFYIVVQGLENEPEIIKKAELLMECFKSSGITCYKLKDPEIKRLINLFNNMTTYNYDSMEDTTNSIPIIKEDLLKEKTIDEKLKEKLEKEKKEQEEKEQESIILKQEEEKLKAEQEVVNEYSNNEVKQENEEVNEKGDEKNGEESES